MNGREEPIVQFPFLPGTEATVYMILDHLEFHRQIAVPLKSYLSKKCKKNGAMPAIVATCVYAPGYLYKVIKEKIKSTSGLKEINAFEKEFNNGIGLSEDPPTGRAREEFLKATRRVYPHFIEMSKLKQELPDLQCPVLRLCFFGYQQPEWSEKMLESQDLLPQYFEGYRGMSSPPATYAFFRWLNDENEGVKCLVVPPYLWENFGMRKVPQDFAILQTPKKQDLLQHFPESKIALYVDSINAKNWPLLSVDDFFTAVARDLQDLWEPEYFWENVYGAKHTRDTLLNSIESIVEKAKIVLSEKQRTGQTGEHVREYEQNVVKELKMLQEDFGECVACSPERILMKFWKDSDLQYLVKHSVSELIPSKEQIVLQKMRAVCKRWQYAIKNYGGPK